MADVLGMGNALVDIMTKIDRDDILKELRLPKGSMQLVDAQTSAKVAQHLSNYTKTMASGGSAANTIHGLARMDISTAFIGVIGSDETGDFFQNDMLAAGIETILFRSQTPSGIAIALVTPDGERTFATHLGAALELSADHLDQKHFEGHKYLYIEGYLVQNEQLLLKALSLAKNANLTIALDLASYNVVESKKEFLLRILKEFVDIVFANEEEAKAICGLPPEEAVGYLASLCETAIIKTGSKGALMIQKDHMSHVPAFKVELTDTTGAGDMFAAGFLYALLKGFNIEKAGRAGTVLAGHVIEVVGAKMDESKWEQIKKQISDL